jgi:hypothetical protein
MKVNEWNVKTISASNKLDGFVFIGNEFSKIN